jgi:hypothetical protein
MTLEGSASAPPVPICASCGVLATTRETCESCGHAMVRARSPAEGPLVWAAVRASFPCRSCGFAFPLEGPIVSDGVDCGQCGTFQRFDKSAWREALGGAHTVADLGGPNPEGRFPNRDIWIGDVNTYAKLGTSTTTFATLHSNDVAIETCPGFPVCRACKRPLDVAIEAQVTTATCAGCGAHARYPMPAPLSALVPKAVGLVADLQHEGRVEAEVRAGEAGVAVLTCPQCGAALTPGDGATIVCAYCHAAAFIPARARPRGTNRTVPPILFFVAFEGPSFARRQLETPRPPTAVVVAMVKAVFVRGLSPLPGIELAPVRPGFDVKQLALTVSLSALALGVGYLILLLIQS